MIEVKNLTLKYPSGKGVFELDFKVNEGEVMGYLGPNGAGKTTTIRALMGFMSANSGKATINGLDCYTKAPEIKRSLGYIPGEIAFPDGIDGTDYLKFLCKMRGTTDLAPMKKLIERFELDTHGKVKKYSKGMKQKLGIVIAFMHNPDVLILDEPTSGLDPLMQSNFIDLVNEEKKKGKTILMSSHMFEEVERTCDNVLIIKDGRIIKQSDVATLKSERRKTYIVKTKSGEETFNIRGEELGDFIKKLGTMDVLSLDVKTQGLEEIFMSFYGKETLKEGK
ncbi:MAG: ABC transporter ATP-binding protein [Oscillospiraceae bacterium]